MTDWSKMEAYEEAAPTSGVEINTIWQAAQAEIKKVKVDVPEIKFTNGSEIIFSGGALEPIKSLEWPVELKAPETTRIYNNKMPTHDPYSNPNALIYYECGCGAILDPLTKSFASLNNHASNTGWKIRFGETGYTPYCVKCGEDVE